MAEQLERMEEFFASRLDGYDEHMLDEVEGCRDGYGIVAGLVPSGVKTLLDIGCGTGLELERLFERLPEVSVKGVDISEAMLGRLKEKYPDKNIELVCGNYVGMDFGRDKFDAAISFQSLHHLGHSQKTEVYRSIYSSLSPGGVYIEGDYMVLTQSEEDEFFAENVRMRHLQGIRSDEPYHFDTPCTVHNQLNMLRKAGFGEVREIWREGSTSVIFARKQPRIVSVRRYPEYAVRAIDYFPDKFGVAREIYDDCITNSLGSSFPLPQWYLMTDDEDNIIGGAGVITNDFVSRMDIGPYLCALYIEPEWRCRGLAGLLIKRLEEDAAALGYDRLYLCTDHTGFYERYGWKFIGTGYHPWGESSRIYISPKRDEKK